MMNVGTSISLSPIFCCLPSRSLEPANRLPGHKSCASPQHRSRSSNSKPRTCSGTPPGYGCSVPGWMIMQGEGISIFTLKPRSGSRTARPPPRGWPRACSGALEINGSTSSSWIRPPRPSPSMRSPEPGEYRCERGES